MIAIERLERPLHIGDFCPPGHPPRKIIGWCSKHFLQVQGLPGVWPVWKLLAGTKVDQIVLRGRGQPVFPPEDIKEDEDEDEEYDKYDKEDIKFTCLCPLQDSSQQAF